MADNEETIIIYKDNYDIQCALAKRLAKNGGFGDVPDYVSPDYYGASQRIESVLVNLRDNVLCELYSSDGWNGMYHEIVAIDNRGWFKVFRNIEDVLNFINTKHGVTVYLNGEHIDIEFDKPIEGELKTLRIFHYDYQSFEELKKKYTIDEQRQWETYDKALSLVRNFWKKQIKKEEVLSCLKPIGKDVEKRLKSHKWNFFKKLGLQNRKKFGKIKRNTTE